MYSHHVGFTDVIKYIKRIFVNATGILNNWQKTKSILIIYLRLALPFHNSWPLDDYCNIWCFYFPKSVQRSYPLSPKWPLFRSKVQKYYYISHPKYFICSFYYSIFFFSFFLWFFPLCFSCLFQFFLIYFFLFFLFLIHNFSLAFLFFSLLLSILFIPVILFAASFNFIILSLLNKNQWFCNMFKYHFHYFHNNSTTNNIRLKCITQSQSKKRKLN